MTIKRSLIGHLIALLLVSGAASASQPMTATLTLLPDSTLPGLPVALVVTIANPADAPQRIGNAIRLSVTGAQGSFYAHGVQSRTTLVIPAQLLERCNSTQCLTVPAHTHRELYINYDASLTGNEFFADERLNTPNTYSLAVSVFDANPGPQAEITTNTATLTIRTPTGVDHDVWQFLNQNAAVPGGVWTSVDWGLADKIARELRATYPSSSYTAWVAGIAPESSANATTVLEAALATNPTPSLRDNLLWALDGYLEDWARTTLMYERDADKAAALDDRARTSLKKLRDGAATETMRRLAEERLAKLDALTPQSYRDSLKLLTDGDPPAPDKVVPHVECIAKLSGNSFAARFGYTNPNKAMKFIPVGNLNKITPAPLDQQQPRKFKTGDQTNVFTATSPGGDLIWHLDGNTAIATPTSPHCQ